MSGAGGGNLRRELEEIGTRAAAELRKRETTRCARAAWVHELRWLLIGPLAIAAFDLLSRTPATTAASWSSNFSRLAADSFVIALLWTVFRTLRTVDRSIDALDGLERLDRELATEGRLGAAYEFAHADAATPFMLAAIEDAQPHVERARSHRLAGDAFAPLPRRVWSVPIASVALCALLALLLPMIVKHASADSEQAKLELAPPTGVNAPHKRETNVTKQLAPEAKTPELEPKPRDESSASKGQERNASREPERDPRESTGKTGEGASADAQPASASSDSRGFVSTQSQPSQPGELAKPSTKKPKPPKSEKQDKAPPKKLEASGATAGKGVGNGSSKNPGSTDWQSKDQVSSDDEQPLGEDAEVDDEDSESEARGGLQPSLRDRRPAVNRDLQIGFGNQPNPDANGRGGPSEQKKSRGVASLVLGVPIPDHVKGQPNPGRTKITQERVEPRSDDAQPIDASARRAREQPIGPIARQELTPWMRELVRVYFQRIRLPNTTSKS